VRALVRKRHFWIDEDRVTGTFAIHPASVALQVAEQFMPLQRMFTLSGHALPGAK
jgi:hypothetical protein